ncbi:MAG: ATP-binding cassette domain-containing protein [Candidatus Eisenbacteria bacterium]|nr:ATP-binding cassette domain-containing protein [Candidatus Eisenbacteria bacterium]
MVSLINASKSYAAGAAVRDVTFRIERGEFVFLIGPSGAGKTTLLKLIHHQIFPSAGTVAVGRFRSDAIRRSEIPELRRHIGFVYQDFRLIGDRSVFENVALVLRVTGAPRRAIQRRVQETLGQVGLMGRMGDRADELSGGEMQRVAIARALVNQPFLLLADEPTGNLDPETAAGIYDLLERVNIGGAAVLVATHDQGRARASGHRIIRLEKGRLAPEPSPPPLRRFPSDPAAPPRTPLEG